MLCANQEVDVRERLISEAKNPNKKPFEGYVKILKEYCQENYLNSQPEINSDGEHVPDLDHAIYVEKMREHNYSAKKYPFFSRLDATFTRKKTEWQVPIDEKKYFMIKAIENFKELDSFVEIESPFCFFNRNRAQLYFYVAHCSTRVLGIWSAQNDQEFKPEGIMPYLLLRDQNKFPWMYLEASMLNEDVLQTIVKTNFKKEVSFAEALLNITSIYAAMQVGNLFPVIGSTKKNGKYGSALEQFLKAAARQFSSYSYSNNLNMIGRIVEGRERQMLDIQYNGARELELPEDERLLKFLQEKGYPFETVLMASQAFFDEKQRSSYGGWGPMRGTTTFVPLINYFPIFKEINCFKIEDK